jgi:hypothetical protein
LREREGREGGREEWREGGKEEMKEGRKEGKKEIKKISTLNASPKSRSQHLKLGHTDSLSNIFSIVWYAK